VQKISRVKLFDIFYLVGFFLILFVWVQYYLIMDLVTILFS
jgi:hypothetical protein